MGFKKIVISCGRCEHRCHHAAARDLLCKIIFRCMKRFARLFWPVRVWAQFGCGVMCILIWCSVCGVVWRGQVPRPHALRELRYNPTRPPMSYVTLPTCVCKYFWHVSACTQIQTLTHEHKCFSQRVRDALVTEARDQACDYVFSLICVGVWHCFVTHLLTLRSWAWALTLC